jgi:hypothetical protein
MSKIQNPIVIIHKNAHHDSYSVAITDGSDNVNDACLWCAMDPEGDGSDADPWVKTSYYMAAEIVRLRQRVTEIETRRKKGSSKPKRGSLSQIDMTALSAMPENKWFSWIDSRLSVVNRPRFRCIRLLKAGYLEHRITNPNAPYQSLEFRKLPTPKPILELEVKQ